MPCQEVTAPYIIMIQLMSNPKNQYKFWDYNPKY